MNHHPDKLETRARALFQAGRLDEALACYRQLCVAAPANAQAWHMTGAIAGMLGNHELAETACRHLIGLRPDLVAGHLNLANILLATGRHDEALEHYTKALDLAPEDPQVLTNLAKLHITRGRHDEAAACLEQALRSDPDNADALNSLGTVQRAAGALNRAEASLRRALELRPDHIDALCNLGALLSDRLQFESAEDCYRRALALQPDNRLALRNYGNLLQSTGEYDRARECYRRSLQQDDGDPETIASMASLLERCGEPEAALAYLEPLIDSGRHGADAAAVYASICRKRDCRERAIELLQPFTDPQVAPPERAGALFALGELHDAAGRHDRAFECFRAGNTLDERDFSAAGYRENFARLRDFFSPAELPRLPRSGCTSSLPVFIVGMPRSGTSLVEQILASHPEVAAGGERSDISTMIESLAGLSGLTGEYPELLGSADTAIMDRLAAHYLDRIHGPAAGHRRFTDKTPFHAIHLGFINLLLPAARIIICRREPLDTCLSIYFHRFNAYHDYATSLTGLGTFHRLYSDLLDYWLATLDMRILEVHYEALVANSEAEIHRLTDFCGLERHPDCLAFHRNPRTVNTPSYHQVRQPIYSSSVNRWKHYEHHLAPLRQALAGDSGQT